MSAKFRSLLLFAAASSTYCAIASSALAVPVQWDVGAGGNGHSYEAILVGSNITWEAASAAAQAKGAGWHLATITSASENAFVESLFAGDPAFFHDLGFFVDSGPWIGAFATTFISGDWKWVTGEPFVFADWGPFEPFRNGDRISYALFGGSTVAWNDIPSGHTVSPQSYIIESDGTTSVPEPTTALLFGTGIAAIGLLVGRKKASKTRTTS